jgi:hypothetical protein
MNKQAGARARMASRHDADESFVEVVRAGRHKARTPSTCSTSGGGPSGEDGGESAPAAKAMPAEVEGAQPLVLQQSDEGEMGQGGGGGAGGAGGAGGSTHRSLSSKESSSHEESLSRDELTDELSCRTSTAAMSAKL